MKGRIFNIQKFSIHDGPGIRTTVFLKGCPLSCKWCANPESQKREPELLLDSSKCQKCYTCLKNVPEKVKIDGNGYPIFSHDIYRDSNTLLRACPGGALSVEGEYQDTDEIIRICLQDKDFYDESGGGVTISGGEGLIQPEFVEELIVKLKEEDIDLAIETTGYVDSTVFSKLAPMSDHILYDIKHFESKKHVEGTGVGNEKILKNLLWAVKNDLDVLVRIPVIPGYNDSLEDARAFADLFKDYGVERVQLLPFHQFGESKYEKLRRNYEYQDVPAYHPEDLKAFKQVLIDNGIDCFI